MGELSTHCRAMSMHESQPWDARSEQIMEMIEKLAAAAEEDPAIMMVFAHYITRDAVDTVSKAWIMQCRGETAHNWINAKQLVRGAA